jgi:hypothetical protein
LNKCNTWVNGYPDDNCKFPFGWIFHAFFYKSIGRQIFF